MKVFKVKRISAGSVFRFNFCAGFVIGLIACVVLLVTGYSLKDLGIELNTANGVMSVGAGAVGAILASVLGGILAGFGGAIIAFFYNLFAAATGGIAVKLDDGGS